MHENKIFRLFAILITTLMAYSHSSLAVQVRAPKITVTQLFVDLATDDEYEGWKIAGINKIQTWTQNHGERGRQLAKFQDDPIYVIPVTENPVLLNAANAEFFADVQNDYPRDGTWLGFKYAFLPESVMPPKAADFGAPIYFFLLKRVAVQQGVETEVPDAGVIERNLAKRSHSYYCYFQAQEHKAKNQPVLCNALLKQAADKGDVRAQWQYAEIIRFGVDGPVNLEKARVYYKLAAEQGLKIAQNQYGAMLLTGEGGPIDSVNARVYFKGAADQGMKEAEYNYGALLENGKGGPVDLENARLYYKRAADQGMKEGQFPYALMLARGKGGPVDLANARVYYKRAADQGMKVAQYNYGALLVKGEGGPVDLINARVYFKQAADQGMKEAQKNYGLMLLKGDGGPVDLLNARVYFKQAADQGLAEAIAALKVLDAQQEIAHPNADSGEPIEKKRKPEGDN